MVKVAARFCEPLAMTEAVLVISVGNLAPPAYNTCDGWER